MKRPALVAVDVLALDAYGIHSGTHYSCGAWIVTEDGALRVEITGALTMRPTPWPWTRPSVAAIPTMVVRR